VVRKILKPQGVGILQTIGNTFDAPTDQWLENIFSGWFLPTLALIADNMAKAGLFLQDVEDLRLHYGMTLDKWINNFEIILQKFAK